MKEESFMADEKLEAMLNCLKKTVPDILCPSGNKVTKLCNNLKCNNALRCGDKQCANCGKALHKTCGHITLEDITEVINERAEGCR